MRVLPSTLRSALYMTYRAVARDSTAIDAQDLQDQWQRTGLRHSDYLAVIKDMTRRRLLTVSEGPSQTTLRLTDAGLAEYYRPETTTLLRSLGDWMTLQRMQWRIRLPQVPRPRLRHRRQNDRSTH